MEKMDESEFKKPILIGKIGKLPRKVTSSTIQTNKSIVKVIEPEVVEEIIECNQSPQQQHQSNLETPLPYTEPEWSGLPDTDTKYGFDVLKSGKIIENVDLSEKPYWLFGRLGNCDMIMAHPTISRYHAVLQYRSQSTDTHPIGFYLYDLGSTHGTFLNKNQIKSRVYVRVQVGHMIKLGCSTRTYILTGPEFDQETESDLTVTELRQKRADELETRKEKERALLAKRQKEIEDKEKADATRGIDWGMGEDADEETDLSENPYAQTNNEELYIDDPKKALRGFMEREGIEYEYICEEQGMGQFLCKVELPIDDERGRPIFAEIIHKGKKKEAVVQCALEACRILDRHGLLRQATHTSRKRKAKNWEENDFYDSDDDTFLDRTGSIEKKRENRMKAKVTQSAETYDSLVAKEKSLSVEIRTIEKQLEESTHKQGNNGNDEGDSLDTFMKELKNSRLDKHKISKLKIELAQLKKEYANVIKLVNIAKPADLPTLKPFYEIQSAATENVDNSKSRGLPIFGKRMKVKVQKPEAKILVEDDTDNNEEMEDGSNNKEITNNNSTCWCNRLQLTQYDTTITAKIREIAVKEQECLTKTKTFLETVSQSLDKSETHDTILDSYLSALNEFTSIQDRHISDAYKAIEETHDNSKETFDSTDGENVNEENIDNKADTMINKIDEEKRKKRNQRRIQHRQERMENEKKKGYVEDSTKADYNMWVPPKNQTGDGRTTLNDKFGY